MICALGALEPQFEGAGHFVADNATVIGNVHLGDDSSVWFNAVLRGDNDRIVVGERSNIQDGSVLHTDFGLELVIGDGVTVGHMVMLHGCRIGDDALIGIGSTIMNGASIGERSIVGAHSLVTENKSFPDGSLIMGSPARVVRELTKEEISYIGWSAQVYVDNAKRYTEQLKIL